MYVIWLCKILKEVDLDDFRLSTYDWFVFIMHKWEWINEP